MTIRNERKSSSAKGPHCNLCVAWRTASGATEPASSEAPWRDQVQSSWQGDVPRAANEAWQDTPPSHNLMYGTLVLEGTETDEQVLYSRSATSTHSMTCRTKALVHGTLSDHVPKDEAMVPGRTSRKSERNPRDEGRVQCPENTSTRFPPAPENCIIAHVGSLGRSRNSRICTLTQQPRQVCLTTTSLRHPQGQGKSTWCTQRTQKRKVTRPKVGVCDDPAFDPLCTRKRPSAKRHDNEVLPIYSSARSSSMYLPAW